MKLIVFDWDGTLMDSAARIVSCLQTAMQQLALPVIAAQDIRSKIGMSLEHVIMQLLPEIDLVTKQKLIEYYRKEFLLHNKTPETLFTHAYAVIEQLYHKKYLLAVATNKGRLGLDKGLQQSGLDKFFIYTRCADEAFPKPHPQMLEDILDFCAISPKDAMMVGDSVYDLEMANHVGVKAIAATYGSHSKEDLAHYHPIAYIQDIQNLLDLDFIKDQIFNF